MPGRSSFSFVRRAAVCGIVGFCSGLILAEEEPAVSKPGEGTEAGEIRTFDEEKIAFCWCPPGAYQMGERGRREPPQDLGLQHDAEIDVVRDLPKAVKVELSRGFWIGRTEVTRAQWKAIAEVDPLPDGMENENVGDDLPVVSVDRYGASLFCEKLTESERKAGRLSEEWEYRLPTEAEWEYACRAGSHGVYCYGDERAKMSEYGWTQENTWDAWKYHVHPVGKKLANAWNLHDMHGNAAEWCRDAYRPTLTAGRDPYMPLTSPKTMEGVVRGGSWANSSYACRCAWRQEWEEWSSVESVGFRVVCARTK